MKILAVETSTEYCSAALSIDGEIDSRGTRAGQRHSDLLLGMVDELLATRGLHLRELTGIAFGEGPGSFTGLRIACGSVQGLAFGAGLPVAGVGTLLAMAAGTSADRVVCCVDARVREIYHGAYEKRRGTWHAVHAPSVCAPAAAPQLTGADWLACGSGFAVYREVLETLYAGQLAGIEPERFPHAREIAQLAAPLFENGETVSAEQAAPLYLRDKVALRTDERPAR